MICNKCNHRLPEDSEFCQYCGSRIEKTRSTQNKSTITEKTPNLCAGPSPSKVELNAILDFQAKETLRAMNQNRHAQPNNENDTDFGLTPQKPIFTPALSSVDGEIRYLENLRTENGERVQYDRRGSMAVDGINGMIDIYDTYLPSGQPYKTVYINMYGATASKKAPSGFVLVNLNTTKAITQNRRSANRTEGFWSKHKLVSITNLITIILTVISGVSIVFSLNLQDVRRNTLENWNPSVVYFVLLFLLGIVLCAAIYSLQKRKFVLPACLSFVLFLAACIFWGEGSAFSSRYVRYYSSIYLNSNSVKIFNIVWFTCTVLIFISTLIPAFVASLKVIQKKYHQSPSYREKCYNKVAKMHGYLEKGIIAEEEYEKVKKDILKYLQ